MTVELLLTVLIRSCLAVVIGGIIGSERAHHSGAASPHSRAAEMRTHVLVCLGAAVTAMTSIFVDQTLQMQGDVFRLSSQVISGIGFLGAGMIILKNNNIITGLTSAAGVWTTGAIGVALGYGFYLGAIIASALFLAAVVFFTGLEKRKKTTETLYVEIDDMYRANEIIEKIRKELNEEVACQIVPPKSLCQGHLGLNLIIGKSIELDAKALCEIENIVFVADE